MNLARHASPDYRVSRAGGDPTHLMTIGHPRLTRGPFSDVVIHGSEMVYLEPSRTQGAHISLTSPGPLPRSCRRSTLPNPREWAHHDVVDVAVAP